MTEEEIDAMTMEVLYLDIRMDKGITQFLDIVSEEGTIM